MCRALWTPSVLQLIGSRQRPLEGWYQQRWVGRGDEKTGGQRGELGEGGRGGWKGERRGGGGERGLLKQSGQTAEPLYPYTNPRV